MTDNEKRIRNVWEEQRELKGKIETGVKENKGAKERREKYNEWDKGRS